MKGFKNIGYWFSGAILSVSFALAIFFWVDWIIVHYHQLSWYGAWSLYFFLTYPIIAIAKFSHELIQYNKNEKRSRMVVRLKNGKKKRYAKK